MYAYIQSKPEDWQFSVRNITSQLQEGVDAVSSAVKELEDYGVLTRTKYQNDKGHWCVEYQLMENPIQGKPVQGKPPNISKQELSKKELSNKEETIYTPAIAVVDKPFSFDEELSKLASDSRKHIKIIAWYLSEKNIECKTKKELDSTIKRYVKPASLLTGYTGAELRSRIKSMNNKGLTWTLDTLANGKDKEM